MMRGTVALGLIGLGLVVVPGVGAAVPPAAEQIAGAVAPAPPEQSEGATVLGYAADAEGLVTLREGTGELVCLADDPSQERFHAACYHRSLEPFMSRGRELRAAGKEREEVQSIRGQEIEAGTLAMPPGPTALYSLTGPAGSFDPATGEVTGANRLFVVYIPYATEASTGLTPKPLTPGAPWIMASGKPWAHIMIMQAAESPEKPAEKPAE